MTRRKTRREIEHERDLPAGTASGDRRDRNADNMRVGDVMLRQTEARAADVEEGRSAANADARGDQRRKAGPSKGKVGR